MTPHAPLVSQAGSRRCSSCTCALDSPAITSALHVRKNYYRRSKNIPKPTVRKCTRVNFGRTSDEEILSIFQNRGQTAGHYWREWTGFLIDLQYMREHVESSGRRTPRNR
jgi:hypothetical protein